MVIIRQQGIPAREAGQVMTSRGLQAVRPPECNTCRERKAGQIYSRNPNGDFVCEDCASPKDQALLKGTCDPDVCPCGRTDHED